MTVRRIDLLAATLLASGLLLSGVAAAQPAPPPPPEPTAEQAPPPVTGGPNTFALFSTVTNLTDKAVELTIRKDGADVFKGKLDKKPARLDEGEEPPTVKTPLTFDIPAEKSAFWEIIYFEPEGKKTCRQAWTGVFAPGATVPTVIAPPTQVNKSGLCDYQIDVTAMDVYFDLEIKLASAPR